MHFGWSRSWLAHVELLRNLIVVSVGAAPSLVERSNLTGGETEAHSNDGPVLLRELSGRAVPRDDANASSTGASFDATLEQTRYFAKTST